MKFFNLVSLGFLSVVFLTGCHHTYQSAPLKPSTASGAAAGAVGGLTASALAGGISVPVGVAVGSAFGITTGNRYDSTPGIESALKKQGAEVVTLGDSTTVYLPNDSVFNFDSAKISRNAYPMISNVVKLAKQFGQTPILIAGNTDNVRDTKENETLAKQQAESVAAYLWAMGVDQKRLVTTTSGDAHPIATNKTAKGSAENRRVQITFRKHA